MAKKIEEVKEVHTCLAPNYETKAGLLELHQVLKSLGINSIGDLEVRISRAE